MPAFSSLFNTVLKVLAIATRQEEEIKGIQIGKEDVKLSLFADVMILYIDNPKDSTKELLKLINAFSKATEYKINIEKSVALLYTNNEKTERENFKNSMYNCFKIIKYHAIKLTEDVKDLYSENYDTKEIN